jgi:hypothetical protein
MKKKKFKKNIMKIVRNLEQGSEEWLELRA